MIVQLDYSKALNISEIVSRELFGKFVKERGFLTGKEIISFSDIPGVNYLAIREIFIKWNQEMSKLKSAYFDYNHPEVKKALTDFLNVLSNHILVKSSDLEDLLQKATLNYLALNTNPIILLETFYPHQAVISIQALESDSKFIKTNKFIFEELIKSFRSSQNESLSIDETKVKLKEILVGKIDQFRPDQQFINSYTNLLHGEGKSSATESDNNSPEIVAEKRLDPAIIDKENSSKTSQLTLNDTLAQNNDATLINRLSKVKIDSIKNEISLIKKFMFINELFQENNVDYNIALTIADGAGSYEAAKGQLYNEFSEKYHWKGDNEALAEFMQIVERRYYL